MLSYGGLQERLFDVRSEPLNFVPCQYPWDIAYKWDNSDTKSGEMILSSLLRLVKTTGASSHTVAWFHRSVSTFKLILPRNIPPSLKSDNIYRTYLTEKGRTVLIVPCSGNSRVLPRTPQIRRYVGTCPF